MSGTRQHVGALLAYCAVAIVFSWPLPLHLSTHLTGSPDGDTGVYVWNQWVFRHELVENRTVPYFTEKIFAYSGRANLSHHNYTTFANLLALPLIGWLGVVASFNVVFLSLGMMSAYAMFLLAQEIAPDAPVEGWLAGVLFAWSPMLATRAEGHFSLVAAAPLPLFLLLLLRTHQRQRVRDAALLGGTVALATWCDVYYAVYCLLLAAGYVAVKAVRVTQRPQSADGGRNVLRAIDGFLVCLACLILGIAITRGWQFMVFGRLVSIRGLYTPVLLLTVLAVTRGLWHYRATIDRVDPVSLRKTTQLAAAAGLVAAGLLSPVLYGFGLRTAEEQFQNARVFWRSSPAGVDLLAFILPNPNHPLAPVAWRDWLTEPMAPLEHVASVPIVVLAVFVAAWRCGWRPTRLWAALGIGSVLVALGPFIHVAGVNTFVPGPWTFLRYVPVVELARTPARFAVMVMLAVAVLFTLSLSALGRRHGRLLVVTVCGLLLFELLPAPRALVSARIPSIYNQVAADPRADVRVLELPFGISSGTFSFGRYSARAQFHQTLHGKPIFGGTLSRVSRRRIRATRDSPVLDALVRLSEGERLDPNSFAALEYYGSEFIRRTNLGYVVINRERASPELLAMAVQVLRLEFLSSDGLYELYKPRR